MAAGAFASLNGANDGASITSLGLTVRGLRPIAALTALGAAVAAVPLVFGAVLVTLALSLRGLPTSITLALIGGIGGAGVGAGLAVAWHVIGLVLLAAAVAPAAGALVATRAAQRLPISWCTASRTSCSE